MHCPTESNRKFLLFIIFLSNPVSMSWNIGGDRIDILKLKTKLGQNHIVLTVPKTSPKKHTLAVEMQQKPANGKIDSEKNFRPKMDNIYWQTKSMCKLQDCYR